MATPFSLLELEQLWTAVGGSDQSAATAAAVATAESGGDPSQINNTAFRNRPGYHNPSPGAQPEYSVGLWQINILAHPQYTAADMLVPASNARAALAISNGGTDWNPWSTFTSGAYLQFLPDAQQVGAGGTPGGGTTQPGTATKALGGWAHLQRAVNDDLPFAVLHGRNTLNSARVLLSQAAKAG